MKSILATLPFVLLIGCTQPNGSNRSAPAPMPVAEPSLTAPESFSKWPTATERPIFVGPMAAHACAMPSFPGMIKVQEDEPKKHGPHARHSIIVRVSPDAMPAFREGKPMPVGAVVVKEKYQQADAKDEMKSYGMMIKREAGYDPGTGDWEYAFVTLKPDRVESRGRLTECSSCHAAAKGRDYLFRAYGGLFE